MSKNFGEFLAECSPDILCLQETRITEAKAASADIPFKYKYFYSAEKAGYSGVSIFSNVEPESVERVSLEGSPEEGRLLCANFGGFNLCSIYVPNSQDELRRLDFRHAWNLKLAEYLSQKKNVVACGDFNVAHNEIDLKNPKGNKNSAGFSQVERDDFTSLLAEASLVDVWRARNPDRVQYTWWSFFNKARAKNAGWRIDYFLVSKSFEKNVKTVEIFDNVLGSDHAPVMLEIGRA